MSYNIARSDREKKKRIEFFEYFFSSVKIKGLRVKH